MRLIHSTHEEARSSAHGERPSAELVRCACMTCGAHTNALRTFHVAGSCPNCGSFELRPVEGAEPLGPMAA